MLWSGPMKVCVKPEPPWVPLLHLPVAEAAVKPSEAPLLSLRLGPF